MNGSIRAGNQSLQDTHPTGNECPTSTSTTTDPVVKSGLRFALRFWCHPND